MTKYREIADVATISDFVSAIEAGFEETPLLWFRGQRNYDWELRPSLHRPDLKLLREDSVLSAESQALSLFRQRSIPYIETLFIDRGNISVWNYLFLMQHFGIPTRLLDWTENALTALYFAVSDAVEKNNEGEDAVVWILSPNVWNMHVFRGGAPVNYVLSPSDSELSGWSPNTRSMNTAPVAIYGDYNSRRIALQQGTFIVFGNSLSSMDHFHSEFGMPEESLAKIRIPNQCLSDLYKSLRRFGFREANIYPDMSGLSKDINILIKEGAGRNV